MKYLILIMLSLVSLTLTAAEQNYPFDDVQKEQDFNQLLQELRCPKCQNQNIADSNALVAIDLKNKTYQLVQEGKSKKEVVDFMVQRYGNFVHYDPPINSLTIWLWLVPILFIVLLAGWIILNSRKPNIAAHSISEQDKQKAAALLAEIEAERKNK
ncbi:cytochrome c-type biogenesis protein [Gayadomonas joobiniege]|uniref:cytochrome c-type biogenesis protein n=1 Tax=Gayadomonas joobiniege TaxID=1234606 RepID=UPI000377B8A5|nr:cytochrome c-type biogenesis protein [Gayadomonas joobiniege]